MMTRDQNIQTLMDFGLTFVQASTYLTLAKLNRSNAKNIARESNIARQDIYRIMPSLQKLGLVEKIISTPTMYRATPLENAVSLLLENKKVQYENIISKANQLIATFPESSEGSQSSDKTEFIIISEISLLLKTHERLTKECQSTLDIIMPLFKYSRKVEDEWSRVNAALSQKSQIKIRLLTQQPSNHSSCFMFWSPLVNKPLFQLKYAKQPIGICMHIFDNRQFTLSVGRNDILPSLWSSNLNVVQLATTYFDTVWKRQRINSLNGPILL